jgi:hypothetical protein
MINNTMSTPTVIMPTRSLRVKERYSGKYFFDLGTFQGKNTCFQIHGKYHRKTGENQQEKLLIEMEHLAIKSQLYTGR